MNNKQAKSGYWKGFILGILLIALSYLVGFNLWIPTIIGLFIILWKTPRIIHHFKNDDDKNLTV